MPEPLTQLFSNFPLICAFLAWLIAQVLKFFITLILYRDSLSKKTLLSSGGMPSSHSATMCALSAAIGLTQGMDSPAFAVAVATAFIVMYDAMGVRRSAGEQAKTLNQLIEHLFNENQFPVETTVREIFGHTPLQVLVGAIIGIVLPFVLQFPFGIAS